MAPRTTKPKDEVAGAPADSTLGKLAAKFPETLIKKNPSGYHYVAIDDVYNRLDNVLGADWNLNVLNAQCHLIPREQKTYGRAEKTAFNAVVSVEIEATVDGVLSRRAGVGADFADDPDKAIKTALANAVKKAANGFGVGRYLWKEEERAAIDQSLAAAADVTVLKAKVFALAKEDGVDFEGKSKAEVAQALADHFAVAVTDLASATTLNEIITAVETRRDSGAND